MCPSPKIYPGAVQFVPCPGFLGVGVACFAVNVCGVVLCVVLGGQLMLLRAATNPARFSVLGVEATGFSARDRIVEFACVTVIDGAVVDEYETLMQPGPCPAYLYGVPSDIWLASPSFSDVVGDIGARLDGSVLVAHNLDFVMRMLVREVELAGSASFDPGRALCTYRSTGQKLGVAAFEAGLPEPAHAALIDARIVASLLVRHGTKGRCLPAVWSSKVPASGVTVRRPGSPRRRGSLFQLAAASQRSGSSNKSPLLYLDALDRCLDDGELSPSETTRLDSAAYALGLCADDRSRLHGQYYGVLANQFLAGRQQPATANDVADRVAAALGMPPPQPADPGDGSLVLAPGSAVCFVGDPRTAGFVEDVATLRRNMTQAGLRTTRAVSRTCAAVVALSDPSSSARVWAARRLGVPVLNVHEFLEATAPPALVLPVAF